MTEQAGGVALKPLILVPAVITFAVTLLRLTGELLGWSPTFFSREAGGGLAVVGIVWLVFVIGRAAGLAFLALLILPATGFLGNALHFPPGGRRFLLSFTIASIVALLVGLRAWPALGRVLLAYGLAARVPVALVMLVAVLADWGTHYEKGPPHFPHMGAVAKWFWIGLLPQMTLWIAFTVVVGTLVGCLAALATGRRPKPATA